MRGLSTESNLSFNLEREPLYKRIFAHLIAADLKHIKLSQWDIHVRPAPLPVSTLTSDSITFFTSGATHGDY